MLTGGGVEAEDLRTHRLLAVSGLANPASFHRVLHGLHISGFQTLDFPDHHWFSEADSEQIRYALVNQQLDALVTTEKDEVRLSKLAERAEVPIYVVAITLHVQPDAEFMEFLLSQSALH